jgi:hypothetical protein
VLPPLPVTPPLDETGPESWTFEAVVQAQDKMLQIAIGRSRFQ